MCGFSSRWTNGKPIHRPEISREFPPLTPHQVQSAYIQYRKRETMGTPNKVWDEDAIKQLITLSSDGVPPLDISRIVQRSYSSVISKLHRMKKQTALIRPSWSNAEDETILQERQNRIRGSLKRATALLSGRTYDSVAMRWHFFLRYQAHQKSDG